MKTLAIIPARGGSKGVPRKNLAYVSGKPLIAYTIEHALQAEGVDVVAVTSDDTEILDVSVECGAVAVNRPLNLATDEATTEAVLQHCINVLEISSGAIYDVVVYLSCTQPYRKVEWINQCVDALIADPELDSAFVAYQTHKNYWYNPAKQRHQKIWWKEYGSRQQREPLLEENTGAASATRARIIKNGKRIGSNCKIIEVDRFNLDIHTEDDLTVARALL
jgi:N-acylneuraminate cytidylyltransferase